MLVHCRVAARRSDGCLGAEAPLVGARFSSSRSRRAQRDACDVIAACTSARLYVGHSSRGLWRRIQLRRHHRSITSFGVIENVCFLCFFLSQYGCTAAYFFCFMTKFRPVKIKWVPLKPFFGHFFFCSAPANNPFICGLIA